MRIGIELRALQAVPPGREEIGRYCRRWLDAFLNARHGHECILYAHADLPAPVFANAPAVALKWLGMQPEIGVTTSGHVLDRFYRANPDGLDVLVLLDPFERVIGFSPPSASGKGPRLAALVHDLSALLSPFGAEDSPFLLQDHRALEELRRYDSLLFLSEQMRTSGTRRLGLAERGTATIGMGIVRGGCATGAPGSRPSIGDRLGIVHPFFLSTGGVDERNKPRELVKAFAKLPEAGRGKLQLVVTDLRTPAEVSWIQNYAAQKGVSASVLPVGPLEDDEVAELYQECAAFVRLRREGSGFDLFQALASGAAVIASEGETHAELVGEAGVLIDAEDPSAVVEALGNVLRSCDRTGSFRDRGVEHARRCTWEEVAARSVAALESIEAPGHSLRPRMSLRRPARVAIFSPFPPMKSGISDYAVSLAEELARDYAVELYHDVGYVPELAEGLEGLDCRDFRLFERYAPHVDYRAVLYQMGNSHYHNFLYEMLQRHPGIVTLHDFGLAGFHLQYQQARGLDREAYRRELLRWYPDQAEEISAAWSHWQGRWDWDAIAAECVGKGWYLNGRVLTRSQRVVVHSPWCVEQARAWLPEHAEMMEVIPLGRRLARISADERTAIRSRFQLPQDALIVGSFGFLFPSKLNSETVAAFETVARQDPRALLLFVGEVADCGLTQQRVAELGLTERVRFLGRRNEREFQDLLAIADIGVNLRRPPTNGETSAALLDLLAAGVPTIVTDVATFSDYPDDVARKVRWESEGVEGVRRALVELAGNPEVRHALGKRARAYVEEHHEWSSVASCYRDLIERCHLAAKGRSDTARGIRAKGA